MATDFILDPRADSSSPARRTGPFKSDLGMVEVGMQLRLSGNKTWRGFSYVGTGSGLTFDVNSPGDTTGSGYQFGFQADDRVYDRVRWYPARRVMINGEALCAILASQVSPLLP